MFLESTSIMYVVSIVLDLYAISLATDQKKCYICKLLLALRTKIVWIERLQPQKSDFFKTFQI